MLIRPAFRAPTAMLHKLPDLTGLSDFSIVHVSIESTVEHWQKVGKLNPWDFPNLWGKRTFLSSALPRRSCAMNFSEVEMKNINTKKNTLNQSN